MDEEAEDDDIAVEANWAFKGVTWKVLKCFSLVAVIFLPDLIVHWMQNNWEKHPISQSAEVFLEYCQKLLEKFRYPWEMMPLMYVILKDAKADIEEASRRIEEANRFIWAIPRQRFYYSCYTAAAAAAAAAACGAPTYLPYSPLDVGGVGILSSQLRSTTSTRPSTPEPSHRSRSPPSPFKTRSKSNIAEAAET